MKNNSGNVTILAINIIVLLLFYLMLVNSFFMLTYTYLKENNNSENLFLIENAIIKDIYNDVRNVNYQSKELSYYSKYRLESDNNYYLDITLQINNKKRYYEAIYDKECHQILQFNPIDKSIKL